MKKHREAQSATSVPVAGAAEADSRVRHYAITMAIRTACFLLMAVLQPVGWWTWVLAIGAVFLPYIAVIIANNPKAPKTSEVMAPERAIAAPTPEQVKPQSEQTIIISETPKPKDSA